MGSHMSFKIDWVESGLGIEWHRIGIDHTLKISKYSHADKLQPFAEELHMWQSQCIRWHLQSWVTLFRSRLGLGFRHLTIARGGLSLRHGPGIRWRWGRELTSLVGGFNISEKY